MSDAAGNSITDLLINQPILVWSLAGGLAILVLAGLLSVFLALRSRFRAGQSAKKSQAEQRKAEASLAEANQKTAVANAKSVTKAETPKKSEPQRPPEPANPSGENSAAIPGDQKGFLLFDAEAAESVEFDEITLEEVTESGEATAVEKPQDENGLAALFSADTIVDPYVQALRDHLPNITINELLTNIRSISQELQEQVGSHAAKN